jgi:hypothetical protein
MENSDLAQSRKPNPLSWIVFILVVFALGALGFSTLRNNPNTNNPNTAQQNPTSSQSIGAPLSPHTIVYGGWTAHTTEITAIDLATRRSITLASLPTTNVKKVTILSPKTLMYIDETNRRDHGKSIKIYEIKEKKEKSSITADAGFGFDDYVVSPNKRFAALWEVSFADGSNVLQGGRSRVYAVDLANPSVKKLLYDEIATPTTPIHYPRAILDNGKVFADTFLPSDPNGGTGWAYGMGVVNFDGSGKQDLIQMQNGTYGTQPVLSPDGRSLLFAGYDGSRGPGTAIKNGYRQAILTPNTVEVLDTTSLQRQKLTNLSNANIYSKVVWGERSSTAVLTVISQNEDQAGLFSYSLLTNSQDPLILPPNQQSPYAFLTQLSAAKYLIATTENSPSSVGNLGEGYANAINQLFLFDPEKNEASSLEFNGLIQYVTTLPQNYFQNVLGIAYAQGGNPEQPNVTIIDLYSDKPSQENLQLKTFLMKPELAPVREEQQTEPPPPPPTQGATPTPKPEGLPRCRDLILEQCRESKSKDPRCAELYSGNKDAACYDSPLYLYGEAGEKVHVTVQTPVYNDTPSYNGGYAVTLGDNGTMLVNGKAYSAINYDYHSNARILKTPTKGTVTDRLGTEKVLREYAKKLGLNEKETKDLVRVGKKRVSSPYVFISFYDHETSTNILPLAFSPQPDSYLNVVFYFKLLKEKPNYSPAPPVFGAPLQRTGLTAVEVSEIVE